MGLLDVLHFFVNTLFYYFRIFLKLVKKKINKYKPNIIMLVKTVYLFIFFKEIFDYYKNKQ